MTLTPMRFKTFVWPHNPRVYSIDYGRKMAAHKIPFGGYVLQDLGQTNRMMAGEGEFVGEGAYQKFGELACVFYDPGPGELVHPLWQTAKAHFVSLRLEQEPRADYVRYSFVFWEDLGKDPAVRRVRTQAQAAPAGVHTVVQGDTLWGIAQKYGLTVEKLLEYNPGIKRPDLLQMGEKVRLG